MEKNIETSVLLLQEGLLTIIKYTQHHISFMMFLPKAASAMDSDRVCRKAALPSPHIFPNQ